MASKTIIEINGRKYDARTGEIIPNVVATHSKPVITKTPTPMVGVIDSMQRPQKSGVNRPAALAPKPKTQKSKTLVRSVVKKPNQKANFVATGPAHIQQHSPAIKRRILSRTPNSRLLRAETTHQNRAVSKFGVPGAPKRPQITPNLSVKKTPEQPKHVPAIAPPISHNHPTKKQVFTHPLAGAESHLAVPLKKRRVHQKIADRLRVSPKVISLTAACFAFIFLASFLAYQRVPNIGMRVAAARAGFSGTIPGTTPAGYAFKGPINYSQNVIAVSYKSNSDNRNFKIVQRPTGWSSEALLTNYVQGTNLKYQAYNDRGLTVYIMDNNNAAWVNGGVWFTLTSSGELSTDQILAMASSM